MKISVIVPVYNVENYITECLTSIINQSISDFEIIIVNDGSTDNSIDNIKNLVEENDNLVVVHKKNGGLSSARNEGLKYAKGEYVIFIDSDDYIEKDFLTKLFDEARKYDLDIACGGYKKFFSDGSIEEKTRLNQLIQLGVIKGSNFLLAELENQDYRPEVWDNLYRREFLLSNHLKFTENLLHEDEEFTPKALLLAERVKLVDTYGYLYRQRENSIMNTQCSIKNIDSIYYIINELKKLYEEATNEVDKICLSRLILNLCNVYFGKIISSNEIGKYRLAKRLDFVRCCRNLNKNHLTFKQKLKYNIPYLAWLNFRRLEFAQKRQEG